MMHECPLVQWEQDPSEERNVADIESDRRQIRAGKIT